MPGGSVFLRDACLGDLPLFVSLECSADTAPFILPYSLKEHERLLMEPGIRYLGIHSAEHERPLGFVVLIVEENSLGLKRMVVGPKGRGYGSAALMELENLCRQMGRRRIWLDVFADNVIARRIYERAGFCLQNTADFFGRALMIYEKTIL